MTAPINLLDLTPDDALARLHEYMAAAGQPAYRAAQVVRHLWEKPLADFAQMTTLPVELRSELSGRFTMPRLELVARQTSSDGTEKFLFRLPEGQEIETVAIPRVADSHSAYRRRPAVRCNARSARRGAWASSATSEPGRSRLRCERWRSSIGPLPSRTSCSWEWASR